MNWCKQMFMSQCELFPLIIINILLFFVDDFNRMTWAYFSKEKLEALPIFKRFKSYIKKYNGFSLKILRHDGELCSNEFNNFF